MPRIERHDDDERHAPTPHWRVLDSRGDPIGVRAALTAAAALAAARGDGGGGETGFGPPPCACDTAAERGRGAACPWANVGAWSAERLRWELWDGKCPAAYEPSRMGIDDVELAPLPIPDDAADGAERREALRRAGAGAWPVRRRVAPPDRFSDETAAQRIDVQGLLEALAGDGRGCESGTVKTRLARACAGWETPPTSAEFHAALRSDEPDGRQLAIVRTWAAEADGRDVMGAWCEQAFTLRELVAALHRSGASVCKAAGMLNALRSR